MMRASFVLLLAAAACSPFAPAPRPSLEPDAGTPEPGPVPPGNVGFGGGTADRLYFAVTGDTRPGACDATDQYPTAAITQIAASMKALKVQFALDLGDHMFVCNNSVAEAQQQMGFYTTAIAGGPSTWWMSMGNHECGSAYAGSGCATGTPDANFDVFMAALKRPKPWYSTEVQTSAGLARFVFVADDAWSDEQAKWLEATLSDADQNARYTIVSRHHPVSGSRTGSAVIIKAIVGHKFTLLLTAHEHAYAHDPKLYGGRTAIVGIGGGPSSAPPGFGTIMQNTDGSMTFVLRDLTGNPAGTPWTVQPQ